MQHNSGDSYLPHMLIHYTLYLPVAAAPQPPLYPPRIAGAAH